MNIKQKYGATALVAGASEGLGAAYAHALASYGCNHVLIVRRQEPLEVNASDHLDQYKIQANTFSIHLSTSDAPEVNIASLKRMDINFFVYNAAISHIGPFLTHPLHEHEKITMA